MKIKKGKSFIRLKVKFPNLNEPGKCKHQKNILKEFMKLEIIIFIECL